MIPVGENNYSIGDTMVSGNGYSWSSDELESAMNDEVTNLVFDTSGNADISSLLSSVVETDFESEELNRVLNYSRQPENWRVGEAIAESYLSNHRLCSFPWPDGRDERKAGSSLPGADLVGFYIDDDDVYFAFGEVKTSSDNSYPPGAMHGRTGLKQQIEDLKDKEEIRDQLFKYLGHRANNASWQERYKTAAKRYLADNKNVKVFGFLVRDVSPNEEDLRARVNKLGRDCPETMTIELFALYLPVQTIDNLGSRAMAISRGSNE